MNCHISPGAPSTDVMGITSADGSGQPSGYSKCICHDHNWGGWSCAWQQRPDDVRICPCQ
jgi:hypothetical protein